MSSGNGWNDQSPQKQEAFWKTTLFGAPERLTIHTDFPRPAIGDGAEGVVTFTFGRAVRDGLERLEHDRGIAPCISLLAAWAALIARLSCQDDVVVGTTCDPLDETAPNESSAPTLPLRLNLSGQPTVAEFLDRCRSEARNARENSGLSLDQIIDLTGLVRNPSYHPLFQTMFALDQGGNETGKSPRSTRAPVGHERDAAAFHLALLIQHHDGEMSARLSYASSLFKRETAERIAENYGVLLEGMLADETACITRLPMISDAERCLVIDTWNATEAPYPSDRCIHMLFEEQATRNPLAQAVVFGDRQLSYGELNSRANRLAHRLQWLGVKPDTRVAICVERSVEMMVGILAILKAGGCYVPLDPDYPEDRLRFMLEDSGSTVLLKKGEGAHVWAHGIPELDLQDDFDDQPNTNPVPASGDSTSGSLAYVIYTSGSTGTPKAVAVEHKSLVNLIFDWTDRCKGFGESHPFQASLWASFCFDVSVFEIFATLSAGGTLHIVPDAIRADPSALLDWFIRRKISFGFLPPFFVRHLKGLLENSGRQLPFKHVLVGVESLSEADLHWIQSVTPGLAIVNGYGPTEATVFCTAYQEIAERHRHAPIGRPIANTRIYMLDEHRQPVPVGVPGEIHIAGAGVARGYLNNPDLTAERFLADPFSRVAGARMYRTGDLGRWLSDGTIEFLGRNDSQVKVRGFRVELGEIEAKLAEYPGVTETAVLAREDSPGNQRLVAYVSGAERLEIDALRKHLSDHLPDYMVPAAFVQLDRLPLTSNGKLDAKRLPAPSHEAFTSRAFEPPRNGIEITIAAIWSELLKLERVGRNDNFLELGGHSLLTMQVISRLRDALHVDVPFRALFTSDTLWEFAERVAGAVPVQIPPVIRQERKACEVLSFAQQRLWFLAQIKGASEAYHLSFGWKMRGALDVIALRRALNGIVERHEALRTTFVVVDGAPMQRVAAQAGGMHLLEQEARSPEELAQLANDEAAQPFDLENGPLIRGRLIREGADRHALLITMHHIVSDGWSMRLFMHELNALYAAFLKGADDPLLPLDIQYADYATWQKEWISGDLLRTKGDYWKNALSGAPELLTLPLDHARPDEQSFAGAKIDFALEASQARALGALSLRQGTTRFVTLLAGWAALLSRLSGQDDVVIGTPMANRGRAEIEQLIGFFVNTLALRVDLSNAPTVAEFLRHVSDRALEAQEHQDVPFEHVVELVNPVRSLAYSPLFQVMFVWENDDGLRLEFPGLIEQSPVDVDHRTTQFDLILTMRETRAGIHGELEYSTALFERDTVERMIGYYQALLAGMASNDAARIAELPILSDAEHALVLQARNPLGLPDASELCIHELFEQQVRKTPDAVAVVYRDQVLTYAALNARANRLAHRLRALGVGPDSLVAICAERSLEMIVGPLAVLKAGGAYVPLDPSLPVERLHHLLSDSAPVALLTMGELPEGLVAGLPEDLRVVDLALSFESYTETNLDAAETGLKPQHLAYVIYTSGSTGKPKGVMVEHRNLVASTRARHAAYGETGRFLLLSPIYFDSSVAGIFGTLTNAGTLVVAEQSVIRDASQLDDMLREQRIDTLLCVPSLYGNYLDFSDSQHRDRRLTKVIVAGEACPPTLLAKSALREPQATVFNEYGPTEGTVWATMHPCTTDAVGTSVPIGRPIASARIYILDAHDTPVPVGVVGQIHIGGAGVARGYLHRPELTAQQFVADPFGDDPAGRMYKTGDMGRWLPDGTIEFMGRNDFQVKIRGFRIELGEIEAALLELPAVREAAVVSREGRVGEPQLVAYLVTSGTIAAEDFRSQLSRRLPAYMVPAAYVPMQALPLTSNGKLNLRALPAPDADAYATSEYEAPADETETLIASIWSALLKVDRIGRRDSFFALGGHSLLIVQVISRLRTALRVDVPLNALFASPVLADFARLVSGAAADRLPPVTKVQRHEKLPLSFAQRRLWFLAQMQGGSEAYYIPYALRLQGRLDRQALRRALDRIIERHEALRTTFVRVDGEPVQRIGSALEHGFPLLEMEARTPEDLVTLAREEELAPFDLERALPVRGRLLRESDDLHTLLITMHHIVSDGWSMGVFAKELSALYNAYAKGASDPLPPLTVQYADYAVWQEACVSGRLLEAQADYWRSALAGAPELLSLPTDRPRPPEQSYAGRRMSFVLDEALARSLRALSARHGATMYMTLLAGWTILLSRFAGQDDIVVGTAAANRGRAEIEGLIGFFVNTLALRLDLSGDPSVAKLLQRVKTQALQAQEHQDLPFEQVVELVNPTRSLAYNPLFQVMFTWEKDDQEALALSGLQVTPRRPTDYLISKFDLTLSMKESPSAVEATLEYATSLFDPATMERIASCYRTLMEGMVADDGLSVSRLPMLSVEARGQVVETFNTTEAPYRRDRCIHEFFEEQARLAPAAVALEFGQASLSYEALNVAANKVAHRLRALGLKPDDRVAICIDRGFERVIGVLGILKAGGAYVPLDPNYPMERLRYIVDDSAPVMLLVKGNCPDIAGDVPILDLDALPECATTDLPPAEVGLSPANLAYVIYTSGSTGKPKGVMVEHQSACHLIAAQAAHFETGQGSRVLQFASYSFDACVFEMLLAFSSGATLVIPASNIPLAGESLVECIRSAAITHALLPPAVLAGIPAEEALETLTLLVVGGDVLTQDIVRRWANGRRLVNAYGPTEITVVASLYDCPSDFAGTPPIGRPMSNTRIYILDAHGEPVPVGVAGELYIGGAGVARGYLNRPELTAERFLDDPFSTDASARMYKTGDLGRWRPDGTIDFLGRNDFQVKIRGFRIELGEIEARLREYAGLQEAVVLAREDVPGDKRLVAYYVGGTDLKVEALRGHLSDRLPGHMIPAAFIRMEAFPLDPNGKLARKALPAPEGTAYASRDYEAPVGEFETVLAAIWSELLKVERIGRQDGFFELGGHSLLTTKVVSRLRVKLNVDVPISAMFSHPTLAELAGLVAEAAPAQLPPMTRADRGELLPTSFAQRRQWFLAQIDGAAAAYHVPYGLKLEGPLDVAALRRALDRIVARHESLRTAFIAIDGEPRQRIASPTEGGFALTEKTAANAEEMVRLANVDIAARFDLEHGPLIRGLLVREAEDRHALLITMHHIVSDGWSMGVFVGELGRLYEAYAKGEEDPLPPLDLHYADYAVWQRTWLSGELLRKQEAYWKTSLLGGPELLTLPIDYPRPPEQSYAGDSVPLVVSGTVTKALKSMGLRHGATPFMVLLAGWAALLSRLSGQDDVVVGTPAANRGRAEIEGLIGFFVNTLALRLDLSGDPTVAGFLDRVRACSLGAQENQDLPFEQVVELVNPARNVAHSPLFQVAFSWEEDGGLRPQLPGVTSEPLDGTSYKVAKFDLSISLRESNGQFEGALEYSTALFKRETVERIAGYYQALLAGMAENDARPLASIPILGQAEHALVTQAWNATASPYPSHRCVHEIFEDQVSRTPDATAIAFKGERLAYAELNRRANRLAHRLRAIGVKPDDRVAICLERGLDMLVGLLGTLKAGAAYVAMDPTYPQQQLKHILADSAPKALLTLGDLPEGVADALDGNMPVLDLAQSFADQPDTNPATHAIGLHASNLAYVIYTSGSTGTPKGVMVEHRNVINLMTDCLHRFEDLERTTPLQASLWTSFSFDVSVFELFVPLSVGATVNIVPDDIRGEPTLLFEWFAQHRINFAYLPPFFVRQMDELMAGSGLELPFDYLLVGVEPLLESTLHRIQSSKPGRGVKIVNGYGPTETTVFSSAYAPMKDLHRNAPIGQPIGNTQTYILDAHLHPVPVGVAGELYIGGAGVARGYVNRPELTAERFVRDPFCGSTGARMYRTGDLVRWMPDGNIEFLGRNDHQVKFRGFRIELGEIETKLTEHPDIREALVLAREDVPGDKALVAYYVAPQAFKAEVLRTHLSAQLPKHMVPQAFVWMESMPLLPNGKLDRKALPAPDLAPIRAESDFQAPRNEQETRIAQIWTEVLGIENIGINDNFFDLGGESFKAFRVVGRIGSGIGVTELFKYPTVRQLAERISGGRSTSDGMLHELTKPIPAERKTLTLICIPFPGGGPISYQPLARVMPPGCKVLGLEIPGHDFGRRDEQTLPLEEIARRCAAEIRRDVTGPIAFYGHCAGGALTIAIAAELEQAGVEISRLFIGGHFPTPHLSGKVFEFFRRVFPIHKWASDRSAFDLLKSFGFFDEITDKAQQDFVMGHFVREHQEIEDFYTQLYSAPFQKLKTPLTSVIGEMDRATTLYQERYREWEYFSDFVDYAVIPKAGHYFIKHQPGDLGEIIEAGIAQSREEPVALPEPMAKPHLDEAPAKTEKTVAKPSLRTFFTVAIGEIISVIGSTLTSFALGVWVYQKTALVSSYALMMVFIILPAIALAPIAGTLADRIDRKKIMVVNNCLAGLSTATTAALIWTNHLQIWHVYVIAAVIAVANAFRLPAYMSVVTQIVPKRYYGKANGFVQLGTGLGAFLGPALAGALMGLIGLGGIVMTDFVTFLIAVSALLSVRLPDSLFERREEPFFKEMIGGWRYIIKRHSLVAMILMTTIANFVAGLIESLVTPLVLASGNPASLGVVMAANGAGILAGSTVMSIWGGTRRRIDGALGSVLLSGLCIAIAGSNPAVLIQALGMFGFGFALALANAHWISTIQAKVGQELQGRVIATNFMLMEATVPLGYLAAGPLADRVFEPLMAKGGEWASTFAWLTGMGPGRGIGLILMLSGAFVVLWSVAAYSYRPIRCLEDILPDAIADDVIEADKDKIQAKADRSLQAAR
ncbi:amino acid adenylation domain-containing protein [Dyella kyungheensis]|uniref:Amino acid adenylation domain-containing protein n=1 Tax=Dyella kyungheensis TaxID=1242174 RepID=A0ABS2JM00_9GAMM|nr:amino acid adenylation domain-containing protein [Dyella kyungheensis]